MTDRSADVQHPEAEQDTQFVPILEAHRQWVDHGWEDAADGMALVTTITRIQAILQQRVDAALRPFDLTFARYEILMLLSFSREGALPMGAMGRRLQVHPTSVTSATTRLERQGLVIRETHPSDRRSKLVRLTEEGRVRAKSATAALNGEVFDPVRLPAAEVRLLRELLATSQG